MSSSRSLGGDGHGEPGAGVREEEAGIGPVARVGVGVEVGIGIGEAATDCTDLPTDIPDLPRPGARALRARGPRRSTAEFANALTGQGHLGRYRVERRLGRGGMGTVYEAVDETLGRSVALKILHARSEPDELRLQREAQALAQLQHRNVVQVYSVERSHARLFITMELVEGQTLDAWHTERRPWRECVEAYVQAGRGLAAAHDKGLVHRDFNPNNCLIDGDGRVRVLDFGLVLDALEDSDGDGGRDGETGEPPRPELSGSQARLTRPGEVLGTWAYMPLEALSGAPADARSDQFSFCAAAYEGLYGERPFAAQSAYEQILELEQGRLRPAPPDSPVPGAVRRILARGLSVRPEERWPSMDELLDRLERQLAPRRRRWVPWAGLVGLGGVVAVVAWSGREPLCTGAAEHLDGIWDPPTAQRVRSAILAVEAPHVADTWTRVEPRLDAYAGSWVAAHTDACEDTRLREEQTEEVLDLRMRCLEDARRSLEALVGAFAISDADTVTRALEAVEGLPDVGRCEDESYVRNQWVRPDEPESQAEFDGLEVELARVWALFNAGRYAEIEAQIESVRQTAERSGHEPAAAELLLIQGMIEHRLGRFEDSLEPMERAFFDGKRLGLPDVTFRAAHQLSFTLGLRLQRSEQAQTWIDHARAEAERVDDDALRAMVMSMQVVLDASGGNLDQVDEFLEVLRLIKAARGERHPEVARFLKNLGTFRLQRGELSEAEQVLVEALEIEEEVLGPHHPTISDTLSNLGSVYHSMNRAKAARESFTRALTLTRQHFDPDHPKVARSLDQLGNVEILAGDLASAREHCEQALEIRKRVVGAEHRDVAASHMSVGRIALLREDEATARVHFERAAAIREEAFGAGHPATIEALGSVGDAHIVAGRYAEAYAVHKDALARMERSLGLENVWAVKYRKGMGRALLGLGRPQEARDQLQRAMEISEREGLPSAQLQVLRFYLLRAQVESGGPGAPGLAEVRAMRREIAKHPKKTYGGLLSEIDDYLAARSR